MVDDRKELIMKKKFTKMIAGISSAAILTSFSALVSSQIMPLSVFAEDTEEQTIYTGECGAEGDNIIWTYDTTTRTMTFSGTGVMETYIDNKGDYVKTPQWATGYFSGLNYDPVEIIFEEGITDVGRLSPYLLPYGDDVHCTLTMPESLTYFYPGYCRLKSVDVTLCGKYGSWFYYNIAGKDNMISNGVAENPLYETSEITDDGVSWSFDYETGKLTTWGSGSLIDVNIPTCILTKTKEFYVGEDVTADLEIFKNGTYCVSNAIQIIATTCYPSVIYYCQNSPFEEVYEACKSSLSTRLLADENLSTFHIMAKEGEFLCGDVDMNGVVDLIDAVTLSKAMANVLTLSDTQKTVADCTGDGTIDDSDVATLMSYLIFLIPSIPTKA
jgi:hypothetical protein